MVSCAADSEVSILHFVSGRLEPAADINNDKGVMPPIMPLVIPSGFILFTDMTLNRRIAPSAAPFHS
jgi:hypothetical protein